MEVERHRWLLLAPLPAIGVGAAVAREIHVPVTAFLPNLVALVVGGCATLCFLRVSSNTRQRLLRWLSIAGFLAIAATLVGAGLQGVHRWLSIGALQLNASAAFLPWILGGLASHSPRDRALGLSLVFAVQLVHFAQPDAAQATALAVGMVPIIVDQRLAHSRAALIVGAASLIIVACTWMRADPLPAVDHVERILVLAFSQSMASAVTALAVMAALFAPMVFALRTRLVVARSLGLAFVLYLGTLVGMTFLGNFPVPVMGAGAGPVLGWCAILAVLALGTPVRRLDGGPPVAA
jgi:cell division protein FtsW (lipid II flippase)